MAAKRQHGTADDTEHERQRHRVGPPDVQQLCEPVKEPIIFGGRFAKVVCDWLVRRAKGEDRSTS